jgi:hypothetical protein
MSEQFMQMSNFFEKFFNIKVEIHNNTSKIHPIIISNHVFAIADGYFINKYILNNTQHKSIVQQKVCGKLISIVKKYDSIIVMDKKDNVEHIKKSVNKDDFVFIFPEGNIITSLDDRKKSNKLCDKLNIPYFNNVLCPRKNGYNTLVDILRPTLITDITLNYVYKNTSITSYQNLLTSNLPWILIGNIEEILLFKSLEKVIITVNERPSSQSIIDIFREKDKELEKYKSCNSGKP